MLLGDRLEFPLNRKVERELLTVMMTGRKRRVAISKTVVTVGLPAVMNSRPTFCLPSRIIYFYVLHYILGEKKSIPGWKGLTYENVAL